MTPAGFQDMVEQLVRDGMLFGEAVLEARALYGLLVELPIRRPPKPPATSRTLAPLRMARSRRSAFRSAAR